MWKSIATAALALAVSSAAMAQSGGGSTPGGTSAGQGATGSTGPTQRLPGTTERSKAAPGSGGRVGTATGKPKPSLPPGPSAADQARRGSGSVDLNRNSATGLSNQGTVGTGVTGSGSMERSSPLPLGPGTGARDTKVPDSSVYNPGLQR